MSELMIFNQEDWDRWAQERVNELEDDMICSYESDTFERDKGHIEEFYNTCLRTWGKIPCLLDILEEVEMFNSEITWHIAELEYQSQGGDMNLPEEDRSEWIGECHDELERYYSDFQYSKLGEYVEDILADLEFAYTYDEDDMEHQETLSDSEIVINDCQSFIFSEFIPTPKYTSQQLDFLIVERTNHAYQNR